VSEAILPEHDRDAIRVMTIHAAKGLEFPITIVSGMTTQPMSRRGVGVVWERDRWHLSGRGDDGSFEEHQPLDEQMSDAERRRLLYVACTRAVDHLVVSTHRSRADDKLGGTDAKRMSSAELLFTSGAVAAAGPPATALATPWETRPTTSAAERVLAHEPWRAEYDAVITGASKRRTVAATRLADELAAVAARDRADDPGLDKHPINIELPPWQRGRYGTSLGRAVHGTLQFCDLRFGSDIDSLARSQCAAEGLIGRHDHVAELVRSAIAAPIVRDAAAGAAHWRELCVVAPVGDRVLEGYIDLLVRTDNGYTIVDYKTDQWSGAIQAAERIARYRVQLAAYGVALEQVLGEPVAAGVLVRCVTGRPAEQIDLVDWTSAVDEVRGLVE
jgi:ATP-dependent helicase/nuclease subunit A